MICTVHSNRGDPGIKQHPEELQSTKPPTEKSNASQWKWCVAADDAYQVTFEIQFLFIQIIKFQNNLQFSEPLSGIVMPA